MTRFENAESCAVFVINLRTGAVGINLTAANHVVLLEPSMCPGVRQQAIGRVYRLGQQRAVQVHHYFTNGTIEQNILMQRGHRTTSRSHSVPITANGMADGTYATETRRDLIEDLF
ncbi:MAG: hypothetical protein CL902_00645 [Dehalococcoidia bacterium]|nr:hypothetical protein [Dehalococcoidia bacterium]